MVLGGRPPGRVGRRRELSIECPSPAGGAFGVFGDRGRSLLGHADRSPPRFTRRRRSSGELRLWTSARARARSGGARTGLPPTAPASAARVVARRRTDAARRAGRPTVTRVRRARAGRAAGGGQRPAWRERGAARGSTVAAEPAVVRRRIAAGDRDPRGSSAGRGRGRPTARAAAPGGASADGGRGRAPPRSGLAAPRVLPSRVRPSPRRRGSASNGSTTVRSGVPPREPPSAAPRRIGRRRRRGRPSGPAAGRARARGGRRPGPCGGVGPSRPLPGTLDQRRRGARPGSLRRRPADGPTRAARRPRPGVRPRARPVWPPIASVSGATPSPSWRRRDCSTAR